MALPVVSGVLPGPVHLLQGGAPWWAELCSCPGTHASILEDLRPGLVLLAINDIPLIFGSSLTHLAVGLFSPSTHWIHLNPDQTFYLVKLKSSCWNNPSGFAAHFEGVSRHEVRSWEEEIGKRSSGQVCQIHESCWSVADQVRCMKVERLEHISNITGSTSTWGIQVDESWRAWLVKRLGTFPLRIIARSTAGWTDFVFETSVTALLLPKQTVRWIVLWSTAGKNPQAQGL